MTCAYAHDDGAYVLGALAPADRAAFEDHLPGCVACRKAVASLAVLPGLLSRLDTDTALEIADDAAEAGRLVRVPPEVLPRVLAAAAAQRHRERRAHRWRALAATAAAAVFALLVGVGVHVLDARPGPGSFQTVGTPPPTASPEVAMRPMTPVNDTVPVTAELGIHTTPDGTRVEMACGYVEDRVGTWTLHLYVWPLSGAPERIATWTAKAGDEMRVSATTQFAPSQIMRVEVRGASGRTLLTWTPA
jgi:hypothetical protein